MHRFYIHKYSSFHQFLQKELLPSIHHWHLFVVIACLVLVLEFAMEEAFLPISSIAGLLLCNVNPIMGGFSSRVELDSFCTWKSLL